MAFTAVVLDFDGVLAKSMEQHARAYRLVLAPFGIDIRDDEVFAREGARSESIIRDFLERAGRPVDDAAVRRLADEKQRLFHDMGTPSLYPDARIFFDTVRRAVPRLALVTGTREENLRRIVPDLLPRLDAVLAQHSYMHDKPHPEPYLKAAAALGVPPEACIVVENAVRGVQSARAAGAGHVVAITTTMPIEALVAAGADTVVPDHLAAARAVTSLC